MAKNATITLINKDFIGEYLELTFEIKNTGDETFPITMQLRPHRVTLPDGRVKQDVFGDPAASDYDPTAKATWPLTAQIVAAATGTHVLKIPMSNALYLSTEAHIANCKLIDEGVEQVGATIAVTFSPEDFRNADSFRMGSFGRSLALSYELAGLTTGDTELTAGTFDSTNLSSTETVMITSDSTDDVNNVVIVGLRGTDTTASSETLTLTGTTVIESQFTYSEILDFRMEHEPAHGTIGLKDNADTVPIADITAGETNIDGLRICTSEAMRISQIDVGTDSTMELVEYRITLQRAVGSTPALPEIVLHRGIAVGSQNVINFDPPIFAHPGSRIKVYAEALTGTTNIFANLVVMRS